MKKKRPEQSAEAIAKLNKLKQQYGDSSAGPVLKGGDKLNLKGLEEGPEVLKFGR